MDYYVEWLDAYDRIVKEERFVGVGSLSALLLELSRDYDLTEDIVSVHITRLGEEEDG